MTWKSRMRKASYRGIPFGVSSDDKEGGRRTVVHEFPQRDDVHVEDLGESPHRFVLQAFVVGADYMEQRDALERALLEPGSGTLVHPWYGEVTVSQFAPYKVKHSGQDGGVAVFTLSFVRAAEPSNPSPTVNTKARSLKVSQFAGLLSCNAFDNAFRIANQGTWVVNNAYSSVSNAIASVQTFFNGNISSIPSLLGVSSVQDFTAIKSMGKTLWGTCQSIAEVASQKGKTQAQLASNWVSIASSPVTTSIPNNPGSTRAQIAMNDLAVNAFIRHIAVVEAASSIATTIPESRTQAKELRQGFMEALDAVLMDESGTVTIDDALPMLMPDELYTAFTDVRASILASLAIAARTAPDVINTTPAVILPSLVLCYQLTGSISLNEDLIARNHILHPCFVPVKQLEVLTYE